MVIDAVEKNGGSHIGFFIVSYEGMEIPQWNMHRKGVAYSNPKHECFTIAGVGMQQHEVRKCVNQATGQYHYNMLKKSGYNYAKGYSDALYDDAVSKKENLCGGVKRQLKITNNGCRWVE